MLTSDQVAEFLRQNPGFFENHVDIIAWSGFVEPAWADAFTKETGCKVNRRVAGTSDEMVQLMRTGDYDLVSASGDASLRLIAGAGHFPHRTQPEEYAGIIEEFLVSR